jgi:hypothetical protein
LCAHRQWRVVPLILLLVCGNGKTRTPEPAVPDAFRIRLDATVPVVIPIGVSGQVGGIGAGLLGSAGFDLGSGMATVRSGFIQHSPVRVLNEARHCTVVPIFVGFEGTWGERFQLLWRIEAGPVVQWGRPFKSTYRSSSAVCTFGSMQSLGVRYLHVSMVSISLMVGALLYNHASADNGFILHLGLQVGYDL